MDPADPVPRWADSLAANAVDPFTAHELIQGLSAVEGAAVAFCRLLERWLRGEPDPSLPADREAALRSASDRLDATLTALEDPLGRYLLELEAGTAEGRSWFGEPSEAELVDWAPVLDRAGVGASPFRVAVAYLELAVLIRALAGLSSAVEWGAAPDRGSLWAGLFDLRENLFRRAQDELRALAAS